MVFTWKKKINLFFLSEMFQTNTSENTLILPDTSIDIKSLLFLLHKNAISIIFLNLLTRLFILILLRLLSEDQG